MPYVNKSNIFILLLRLSILTLPYLGGHHLLLRKFKDANLRTWEYLADHTMNGTQLTQD
jgi:hypothetical protein